MSAPRYPLPEEVREDVYALLRTIGGELWSREQLPPRDRVLVTIAVTATLGQDQMLREYVRLARTQLGVSRAEVCEAVLQTLPYAGSPAAIAALGVVKELFDEEDA